MEVGEEGDICIKKTSVFVPYRPPAFLHSSFCPCAGVARRDAAMDSLTLSLPGNLYCRPLFLPRLVSKSVSENQNH